jgi:beta-phosphoglucomutase-like phosphatase (HAD superfamily)
MIETIIFDFDGVILESVTVKTEAFRELFSSEPDCPDEIVEFHKRNGGMSRYDKFRHVCCRPDEFPYEDRCKKTRTRMIFPIIADGDTTPV